MANKFKGEVELKAGEQAYVVRFTTNEMCELEDFAESQGRTLETAMTDPRRRYRAIRKALEIGIARSYEDQHKTPITERIAGDVMDAAGGLEPVAEAMKQALNLAFPELKPGTGGASPNAKGPAGTGKPSSPRP